MVIQKVQARKKDHTICSYMSQATVIMASKSTKTTFSQLIENAHGPYEYSLGISG